MSTKPTYQELESRIRELESSLRESDEKFNRFLMNAPMPYQSLDENGNFLEVNQYLQDTLGYSREELIGHNFGDFLEPEWVEHFKKNFPRFKAMGEVVGVEFNMVKKDGSTILVSFTGKIQQGDQGQFQRTHCIFQDITQSRQAEQALQESHERFLTVLDSIDATIYVADMETYEILFMNKNMIDTYGKDLTGGFCWKEFRGEDSPCSYCNNDKLLDENYNSTGVHVGKRKNQKTNRMYVNYDRAITWTNGRLARIQIATDITELLSMEDQLRQSQKMESVGRLAGGVAHDFNNMLSVILGHTELALDELDPTHPAYEDLEQIEEAAKRSSDITKQLLAFARKQIVAPKVINLSDTVSTMLKMLSRLVGESIQIEYRLNQKVWPILIDPSQVDQILINLCVNARDAIEGTGKIIVETSTCTLDNDYCMNHQGFSPGQYVKLSISDDGCGIDNEDINQIFEPFFTTKDLHRGSGLGLATVYGIVKQNSGFINVYSERDQGTIVTVYLPRYTDTSNIEKEITSTHPIQTGNETILVVEDEVTILNMIQTVLSKLGYTVLSAHRPSNAIQLAKHYAEEIHLILTDMIMPEMDGTMLVEKITAERKHIKHLFMSGYTSNVISKQGILDDDMDFIQKPFTKKEISEKIRQVLDHKK